MAGALQELRRTSTRLVEYADAQSVGALYSSGLRRRAPSLRSWATGW